MKHTGYILLEALVGIAVFGLLVISILPSIGFLLQRSKGSAVNNDANLLLQQGMEVAYNIFASDWTAYPNGTYQIGVDETSGSPTWAFVPGVDEEIEAKFTRVIEIQTVTRNAATGIVGPGDVDPNSRRVVTTVSWNQGTQPHSVSAELLLINTQ